MMNIATINATEENTYVKGERKMVHLLRNIKCMYNGTAEFKPEGIPDNSWMPVVGYETRRRNATKPNSGEQIVVEDTYLKVINNNGKLTDIAAFNCKVTIDNKENALVSLATSIGQLLAKFEETCPEGMLNVVTHGKG